MENMIDKIRPELLIVAIVLYFIGMALKKIKKIKDNYIPIILGALGIIVGVIYCGCVEGWNYASVITGFVQGILCAGCSTYVNQVIKQLLKANNVDEEVVDVVADAVTDSVTKK